MKTCLLKFVFLIPLLITIELKSQSIHSNDSLKYYLTKSLGQMFQEQLILDTFSIKKTANNSFLILDLRANNFNRLVSIRLIENGNELLLDTISALSVCSSSPTYHCKFFMEQSKIVSCQCIETGTISNHCHYKQMSTLRLFQIYRRMSKQSTIPSFY